jgi:hypothetical protein
MAQTKTETELKKKNGLPAGHLGLVTDDRKERI